MDHQTALNGSDRPSHDLNEHLGAMAHDVGRLAELQARLVVADLRQSRAALLCTSGCWLTASMLFVATLPIALAGLGLWLADVTELTVAGGACVRGGVSRRTGSHPGRRGLAPVSQTACGVGTIEKGAARQYSGFTAGVFEPRQS